MKVLSLSNANIAVARHRRKLWCLVISLLVGVAIVKVVISMLPSGYRELECVNNDKTMRRSEKLLEIFTKVAAEQHFPWWADYGMLLGGVRDGYLLPWDKDMDAAFLDEDMQKYLDLKPHLEKAGLSIYDLTVCYTEDLPRMSVDSELVVSRLEFFVMVRTPEGLVLRADLKDAALDHSVKGWVWWKLLTWTMTTNFRYTHEIFPLSTVELRAAPSAGGAPPRVSTDGENVAPDPSWRLKVPAPKDSEIYLERIYGSSWRTPKRWKLTCYI